MKSIIMSGESVWAILAGKKSQTRRILKPQPPIGYRVWGGLDNVFDFTDHPTQGEKGNILTVKPRFAVGDWAYVKETFQLVSTVYDDYHGAWEADEWTRPIPREKPSAGCDVLYRATDPDADDTWRSPLFMPQWASRCTLYVNDVSVQRLHDISEEDAIAEGMWDDGVEERFSPARADYYELWESLNGKTYPWMSNPWVWRYCFEVVNP